MRLQQLFKSAQKKIDDLSHVRVRLARFLREQRMARKIIVKKMEPATHDRHGMV